MIFEVNDDTLGVRSEGSWTQRPGNDRYQIRNPPWRTCEINCGAAGLMNTVALRLASPILSATRLLVSFRTVHHLPAYDGCDNLSR
jgi:hypothetical protein